MLDRDAAVRGAVVGIPVVKAVGPGRPEGVEVLVESVDGGESVLREFEVALEQLAFAGALHVGRLELSAFAGVLPRVFLHFTDALVAVLVPDALLAVLERFAFVVESILNVNDKKEYELGLKEPLLILYFFYLGGSAAHFGEWSISEQVAVASVGPVLSLVELVRSSESIQLPEFGGDGLQILVSAVAAAGDASVAAAAVSAGSGEHGIAGSFDAVRVADVIFGDILSSGVGGEKSEKLHIFWKKNKIDF